MKFFQQEVVSLSTFLVRAVSSHWKIHLQQIDPILPVSEKTKNKKLSQKTHFLFAFAVSFLTVLYGIFGLHYEATGNFPTNFQNLLSSPYIYTHQVMMQVVWPQLDFGLGFRFYLVTNGNKEHKLYVNGKTLPKKETAKMLTVRWQVKFALGTLISSYYIFLTAFFYANIWFNDVYERTIASAAYWFAVFPLYIAYILYAIFGNIGFIILAVWYIRIQQIALLDRFVKLIKKVKKSKVNNNRSHWKTFISFHKRLTFLCQTTEAYSRRCTPFLCVVFPFYITVQCYLLYIAVFVDTPPEQVAIFYVSIVGCNMFLFVITHECAGIVKNNGAFERLTREYICECHLRLKQSEP
ncbi:hypothetical protein TYRP_022880, partial [Tyrophagus putrescentiae]